MSPFDHARSLLGPHAVLLPVKQGTKVAALKAWQRTTLLDTVRGSYQQRIQRAPAVAVLLGPPSRDLIAIDFDRDESADEFMALNPSLAETLRTRGARGCALWAIMVGRYPERVVSLTDGNGGALGEWRGGSGYSIVSGKHPNGHLYTVLKQTPPTVLTFESIHWPRHWRSIPAHNRTESEPKDSESDAKRTRQPANADRQGRAKTGAGAIQKTASSIGYEEEAGEVTVASCEPKHQHQLEKLYERYIEDHWTAAQGKRNEFIRDAVPFLFHAMCESAVTALVMRYYDFNCQLFKDSRETHQAEANAHLINVAARFRLDLTQRERRFYDACRTEKRRAAYRICRHLSKRRSNRSECGEGGFFLSYADIGARLLVDPKGARKLMQSFVEAGIIVMIKKGLRWEKDRRPQATWWRYEW